QFNAPIDHGDPRLDSVARGEWGLEPDAIERLTASFEAAVADGLKLIRREGGLELIDLERDPLELSPTSVAREEAPPALLAALDHPAAARVATAGAPEAVQPPPDELERIERQMRTLGYL